jgi:hypothetical protein
MELTMDYMRMFLFPILCVFALYAPQYIHADDELSRGHKWLRTHPFTIDAVRDTSADLKTYNKVGFSNWNVIIAGDGNRAKTYLSEAAKSGLKWQVFINITDPDWYRINIPIWRKMYPGNIGWNIGDEVNYSNNSDAPIKIGECIKVAKQLAPDALIYTSTFSLDMPGYYDVNDYKNHIDRLLSDTQPDVLMFDQYPFYRDGIAGNFYMSLSIVREKALAIGIPYWAWLQSHGWTKGPFNQPNESQMRFQAFAALAFGFTGFSYWTYDSAYDPYSASMLDANGKPTHMYNSAVRCVPEIRRVGSPIRFLKSTEVKYVAGKKTIDGQDTIVLPSGVEQWTRSANNLVESIGLQKDSDGLLIGFFKDDNNDNYIMIVNPSCGVGKTPETAKQTFSVQFAKNIKELSVVDRKTGNEMIIALKHNILNNWKLPGGTGDLFKLNPNKPIVGLK